MSEPTAPAENTLSLEQTVSRLEAILVELESGEADLEKSIELYAEGKKLGAQALKRLDHLDRRIQLVTGTQGDELTVQDFDKD